MIASPSGSEAVPAGNAMVGGATIRIAGTLAAMLAGAGVLGDTAGGESSRVATMLAGPMVSSGVEAYFRRESYRPGDTATLVVETPLRTADLRILRSGDVPIRGIARDEMRGAPVTESRRLDLDRREAAGRPNEFESRWATGRAASTTRSSAQRAGWWAMRPSSWLPGASARAAWPS